MAGLALMTPTAEACIAALVACKGNTRLAGERLGIDEIQLQVIIADDPNNIDILTQQIRVHTVLSTFELMGKSMMLLSAQLGNLDSYDLSKHTLALLQIMEKYTNDNTTTQNVNVNDVLLKSLPTEVRDAVKGFLDNNGS